MRIAFAPRIYHDLRHCSDALKSLYGLPTIAKWRKIPAHAQTARVNNRVIMRKKDSIRISPTQNSIMAIRTYFRRVRLFIFSYMYSLYNVCARLSSLRILLIASRQCFLLFIQSRSCPSLYGRLALLRVG
jgi:hypothetical protein